MSHNLGYKYIRDYVAIAANCLVKCFFVDIRYVFVLSHDGELCTGKYKGLHVIFMTLNLGYKYIRKYVAIAANCLVKCFCRHQICVGAVSCRRIMYG